MVALPNFEAMGARRGKSKRRPRAPAAEVGLMKSDLMGRTEHLCSVPSEFPGSRARMDGPRRTYETPELVNVGGAKKLMRGPVEFCYYDCGSGLSRYDQGCGSHC